MDLVKFLVENGASIGRDADEWQNTPLHACAINGHAKVAEYLISQGADVNEVDNIGSWTPLYAASYFGHDHVVRVLLAAGADPTIKDKEHKAPVDVVCEAGYRSDLKPTIQALLLVSRVDIYRQTYVHTLHTYIHACTGSTSTYTYPKS